MYSKINDIKKSLYLIQVICFALSFLVCCVDVSIAAVDLPWSTTYNCAGWDSYYAPLDCDGMGKGLNCQACGKYEEITPEANYPGGGGGNGQRHWIDDGKNHSTGSISVIFNNTHPEIWIRFYVRFQTGFQWAEGNKAFKMLYIHSGPPSHSFAPFYLPLYSDSMSLYAGVGDGQHHKCTSCGWETLSLANGDWNCVEIHMKSETAGNSDGIFQVWINGNIAIDDNAVDFGLVSNGKNFSGVSIGSNADSPINGGCYYVDYDDIAINTTGYIGPISGSEPDNGQPSVPGATTVSFGQ